MRKDSQQDAVWRDFTRYSTVFQQVKELLAQGKNVVAVLGAGVAISHPYSDTTEPMQTALRLQQELVRQTGVPLPIDEDGRERFAYLAWQSTDAIDAPSEIATVALANTRGGEDLYRLVKPFGVGRSMKRSTLDEI